MRYDGLEREPAVLSAALDAIAHRADCPYGQGFLFGSFAFGCGLCVFGTLMELGTLMERLAELFGVGRREMPSKA